MKLAIIGSRDFNDYQLMKREVLKCFKIHELKVIVSGGARGADSLAEQFAEEFGLKTQIFPADWNDLSHLDANIRVNKWGKKYDANAGFRRNKDIVRASDAVIAFQINKSSGTQDSIDYAKKLGKKLIVIEL